MSRADFAARMPAGRVMRHLIEGAEQETAEQVESPARAAGSVMVGAADDRAERHADEVADRVLARLSTRAETHPHAPADGPERPAPVRRSIAGAIGFEGGALDEETAADLASARGAGAPLDPAVRRSMESGFDHGLPADVRVHTDDRAARLAAGMNAEAFTQGRDIFFSAGAYDPGSAAGQHLLAHELTHVVQERGGAMAHRRLRGTAKAMRTQGEENGDKGKSSGRLRKLVGKLTNWDNLVKAVQDYEAEEDAVTGGGRRRPDPTAFQRQVPKLVRLLTTINKRIAAWREANDEAGQDAKVKAETSKKVKDQFGNKATTELSGDIRTKANRRQTVAMLAPRVGNELLMLKGDGREWLESDTFSADLLTGHLGSDAGAQNSVHFQSYATGGGGSVNVAYKSEHGFKADRLTAEKKVGIQQVDPNFGARSVALYRLDRLFSAGVTARAEFAVHTRADGTSELGQVLHMAEGTAAGHLTYGTDSEHAQQLRAAAPTGDAKMDRANRSAVAMDDPALQRGLNKLQLLDAIAGQIDRHMGNYFVASDASGKVTGVTGIDLDEAFGESMTEVQRNAGKTQEFRGIPDLIDKEMGERILQVTDKDVHDALYGLLNDQQIDATVKRFQEVKAAVQQAKNANALREDWGREALKSGVTLATPKKKSYQDDVVLPVEEGVRDELSARAGERARLVLDQDRDWNDLPPELIDLVINWVRHIARIDVSEAISKEKLPSAVHHRLLDAAILTYLRAIDVNLLIVQWQEATPASEIAKGAHATGLKAMRAKLPDLVKAVQAMGRKTGQ